MTMSRKIDKKFICIIGLFLISAVVSWTLYFKEYRQADSANIHEFPSEIDGWVAEEITITDKEYALLETRNAFTRKYTNADGDSVYLFVVYSQTNRKVVHPPEICYTGGGATFLSTDYHTIHVSRPEVDILCNKYLVEQGAIRQHMCYWFKVGATFTHSYLKGQALIAIKKLTGQSSSGSLIRISSVVDPDHPDKSLQTIDSFVRTVTPYLYKYLP